MSAPISRPPEPARTPWSRRDESYEMGYPTPPKRASAGQVISVQRDTVTVVISDEELPGVIPLGDMPAVGAIVEVEARGDLLVIPLWVDGDIGLGDWYFLGAESPDWEEDYEDVDVMATIGSGEHVWHLSPGPTGTLWNSAVWPTSPDDVFDFACVFDLIDPGIVVQVRLVMCWAAASQNNPNRYNGEIIAYGTAVTIDGSDIPFSQTVNAPNTFTKPGGAVLTPGTVRLGLRFLVP